MSKSILATHQLLKFIASIPTNQHKEFMTDEDWENAKPIIEKQTIDMFTNACQNFNATTVAIRKEGNADNIKLLEIAINCFQNIWNVEVIKQLNEEIRCLFIKPVQMQIKKKEYQKKASFSASSFDNAVEEALKVLPVISGDINKDLLF